MLTTKSRHSKRSEVNRLKTPLSPSLGAPGGSGLPLLPAGGGRLGPFVLSNHLKLRTGSESERSVPDGQQMFGGSVLEGLWSHGRRSHWLSVCTPPTADVPAGNRKSVLTQPLPAAPADLLPIISASSTASRTSPSISIGLQQPIRKQHLLQASPGYSRLLQASPDCSRPIQAAPGLSRLIQASPGLSRPLQASVQLV